MPSLENRGGVRLKSLLHVHVLTPSRAGLKRPSDSVYLSSYKTPRSPQSSRKTGPPRNGSSSSSPAWDWSCPQPLHPPSPPPPPPSLTTDLTPPPMSIYHSDRHDVMITSWWCHSDVITHSVATVMGHTYISMHTTSCWIHHTLTTSTIIITW